MGGLSILLYDRDVDYIRNLARSLQRFFDPGVRIETFSDMESLDETAVAAKKHGVQMESSEKDKGSFRVDEEFPEQFVFRICQNGQVDLLGDMIYKYQPVSQIAQLLLQALPKIQQNVQQQLRMKQKWYGIFGLDRQDSAMAFSCCIAGILGEHHKVLLLCLTQFSGIDRLLGKEQTCDTEGFFLQMRRASKETLFQVQLPDMILFPGFELLREPENPEVLCELETEDLQKLIRYLEESSYDAVIWVAGQALRGMQRLFDRSCRVFLPEAVDACGICRRQVFENYCMKMQGDLWKEKIREIFLPDCEKTEPGEHLLWIWRQSAVGKKAEECIKECETGGD